MPRTAIRRPHGDRVALSLPTLPRGAVTDMKRFQSWFNGLSMKKRLLLIVLPILVPLIVVIELLTTLSSGRVLAEGKNLGVFETSNSPSSENPFKFDPSHTRRFVITKIEAFGPGVLDHFPPDCGPNTCQASLPEKQPIVVIWPIRSSGVAAAPKQTLRPASCHSQTSAVSLRRYLRSLPLTSGGEGTQRAAGGRRRARTSTERQTSTSWASLPTEIRRSSSRSSSRVGTFRSI